MKRALGLLFFFAVMAACTDDKSKASASSSSGGGGGGADAGGTDGAPNSGGGAEASDPPVPSGCVTDVTPGDKTFTCEGLSVDVSIPASCIKPGCGLITELHGDTGTGALMDAHTNLKALGKEKGYVVIAPN